MPETWKVEAGMPSWHQYKAGATCAAVYTGYQSEEAARAFADAYRERHREPAIVSREVKPDAAPATTEDAAAREDAALEALARLYDSEERYA